MSKVKISENTAKRTGERIYQRFANEEHSRLEAISRINMFGCRKLGDENPVGKQFRIDESDYINTNESCFSEENGIRNIDPTKRFSDVFGTILQCRRTAREDVNFSADGRFLPMIEQPAFEFLAGLDRMEGIDLMTIREEQLRYEIEQGLFDNDAQSENSVRSIFETMTRAEQRVILRYMLLAENSTEFTACLEAVLICFFSDSRHTARFYYDIDGNRFVLCTELPFSEKYAKYALLISKVFGSMIYPLEIVWGASCGVLEHEKTMLLDKLIML